MNRFRERKKVMPSENTYADRHGRGKLLNETIKQFDPVFSPFDTSLKTGNQDTFLESLAAKSDLVNALRSDYTSSMEIRIKLVKDVKTRSSMVRNFVESVVAYKVYWTALRNVVKKILHYKPPKPPKKAGETEADTKKRNRGEQSYADIASLLKNLISLLQGIAGYAPTNTELTVAELTALHASLVAENTSMGGKAGKLDIAIVDRKELFDGNGGLRDRMKATKAAVRSQYGNKSTEYLAVKGIGYSR
jgi:hypothetical protein